MRISDWSSDVGSSDLADAQGLPGLQRRRLFRAVHLMAGDAHMSLQQGHQGARVCDANLESGTDGGDGTAAGVDNKWARGITLHLELRLPLLQVHPAFARAVALHQHGLRIECEPGTV